MGESLILYEIMTPSRNDPLIPLLLLSLVFVIVVLFNSVFVQGNTLSLKDTGLIIGLVAGAILVVIVPYIIGTLILSLKKKDK
jgi:hypothetical protein